jgi:hypothetical protein
VADHRKGQVVPAVENKDVVVIEIGLQPDTDPLPGPRRIEDAADVLNCAFRRGNAFHFAQHALAVVGDRTREQLLFMIDGDHVCTLGRRQHRDDDANNCDGDDNANWDHHTQTSAIPTGVLPHVGSAWAGHSRHDRGPLKRPVH